MNRRVFLLSLDISMLVLVCVLEALSLTGMTVHEWLGFALCPLVLAHVVLQWPWFATQWRRIFTPGAYRVRINAFLNIALLLTMAATLISGVLNSNQIYPHIGEGLGRSFVWQWVHDSANGVLVGLVALHLGLNWNWVLAALRRRAPKAPAEESALAATVTIAKGRGWQRAVVRGLVVFLVAWLAAWAAYAMFAPFVGYSHEERVAQTLGPAHGQSSAQWLEENHRFERAAAIGRGIPKLAQIFVVVLVMALVAHYGLRLRL